MRPQVRLWAFRFRLWRSLVACSPWKREVAGSNPAALTRIRRGSSNGRADALEADGSGFESSARHQTNGALAQPGERLPCKQEAVGSIPTSSTKFPSPTPVLRGGLRHRRCGPTGRRLWRGNGPPLGKALRAADRLPFGPLPRSWGRVFRDACPASFRRPAIALLRPSRHHLPDHALRPACPRLRCCGRGCKGAQGQQGRCGGCSTGGR